MNIRHLSTIANVIWFQACWFACVLLGNKAAMVVLGIVIIAYLMIQPLRNEIWLVMAICALGFLTDSVLIAAGILQKTPVGLFPPLWLTVLWLAFATTLNHSLKPLMNRRALFLMLALLGGPLCYQLGVRLSDIEFGLSPLLSLSVIAIVWLLAGYCILLIYDFWKGHVYRP